MPEKPKSPQKREVVKGTESKTLEEEAKELADLIRGLSEGAEMFPFPGIEPKAYEAMKSSEEEFPGYTTPVDILVDRLRGEGMRVFVSQYSESGNVYIVPGGKSEVHPDDAFVFPRHLQINDMTDERIKKMVLLDKAAYERRSRR